MSVTAQHTIANGIKDPYLFATALQCSQPSRSTLDGTHSILFNKGRYFETTIYDKGVLKQVSELSGVPIDYETMIVGSWQQMEDFVIAMNILGYYVKINIDWI